MSKIRVAINGFGRIGRNAFKIAFDRNDLEVVAINDLLPADKLAYLLKYDSNYGQYQADVLVDNNKMMVGDRVIDVWSEADPIMLPWHTLGIDIVLETTGKFISRQQASQHIEAGAKKVIVSSPMRGASSDIETIVMGVNEDNIDYSDQIISCASCTTNSVAPILSVIDSELGVSKAILTTVHSYTSDQALVDGGGRGHNWCESRDATQNIIPLPTNAAKGVSAVLPQFGDKFDGLSLRVPTAVVSISDLTLVLNRDTTVAELNDIISRSVKQPYFQGILDVSSEPLVSRDYLGSPLSGVIDLTLTKVVGGNLVKIMIWYDNEWGYSNRLIELVADVGRGLRKEA